ncbi:hypothetical protein [Rhodoferax sp. WC2427]|uniref:hypothetical protein n=1 Tax=Rhodoferax sp. WC2427 TaxID=3234144 RepID=UPI00346645E1
MTTTAPFIAHYPRIIGLTGLMGSGKDTIAEILRKQRNYVPVAFADPLRQEIMDAFGIPIEVLTDRATKEAATPQLALSRCRDFDFEACMINYNKTPLLDMTLPRSPRWIMQRWGTEYRRAQDPHYWTKAMNRRLSHLSQQGQCIAVTDVRFMNEALLVREHGGYIWQVNRGFTIATPGAHKSETDGGQFWPDRTIDNSGDLAQLQSRVLALVPAVTGVTA